MTLRVVLGCCVLLCTAKFSLATEEDEKCRKMEGRTDSQMTTLRKLLLCNYDKRIAPVLASAGNRVAIKTTLANYRVEYKTPDELASVDIYNMLDNSPNWFKVSTYILVTWKDPRLQWNITQHNRTRIHFDMAELWTPDVDVGIYFATIFADNDGTISAIFWSRLIGNCWPIYFNWGDRRECVLSFRVNPDDRVKLIREKEEYEFDHHKSNSGTWSVVTAKRVFPLREGEKNEDLENINKHRPWKYGSSYFETKFVIQRNFAVQDAAIFAPAAILVVLLIMSTWIPASNTSRVAMISMIVVVQVFMFHRACRAMPFLPHEIVDIVALYKDLIICSGAAVVEWLIAYNIATQKAPLPESQSANVLPKPSSFPLLKSIFLIPEKGSKSTELAALLDRITFLVLTIISFTLVVVLAKRPPTVPIEAVHTV